MRAPFLARVLDYARRTGIRYNRVPRWQSWSRWGLPDMRGFTPHLRMVNVARDQSTPRGVSGANLWLIHDILHIVFYDFAAVNLGRREWSNPGRFIEIHLASEAFAVLALDYHHLIFTAERGLAIDLHHADWARFQKFAPALPDLDSYAFARNLVEYYLSGEGILATLKIGKGRGNHAKKFDDWIGHEQRYATKQRFYVQSWLDDLQAKNIKGRNGSVMASVEDSEVALSLWSLLQLIHHGPQAEWDDYVKSTARSMRGWPDENYFSPLAKYRRQQFPLDFRFTDYRSLDRDRVLATIEGSVGPTASALFLFWQIIAEEKPALASLRQRKAVRELARESQGLVIKPQTWLAVQDLTRKLVAKRRWKPQPRLRSTFFLP